MSVISAAATQNLSDQVAAKMQLSLNGIYSESMHKTTLGMVDLLNTSVGADARAALAADCIEVDRFSYPERVNNALAIILARSDLGNFVRDLAAFVRTGSGGSFASFSDYVKQNSILVHPLFAELMRQRGGDQLTDPSAAGNPIGVFAPAYGVVPPDRLIDQSGAVLTDLTVAAANPAIGDMPIFANQNDILYIGSRAPFTRAIFGLSTLASATIAPTFSYWNGNLWVQFDPTAVGDNSFGLIANDTIQWTMPDDWEPSYFTMAGTAAGVPLPTQERLYTIAIERTAPAGITAPVATCLSLVGPIVSSTSGTAFHRAVQQPPLALLRITAANSVIVDDLTTPDMTQFLPAVGQPASGSPIGSLVQFRALSNIGAPITLTVAYENQDKVNVTHAQAAWASPAALATIGIVLASNDTGLRDIIQNGWTAQVASAGVGVIAVEIAPGRVPKV